LITNNKLF